MFSSPWVSRTTWSNRKKKHPTTSALWDSVASFRSHWILVSVKKHQTHKLVYLMGQHWPSLGLLPSGHQCREFGVIQQVSTELLRSFVKRTWETRLITIFLGPKRSSERLSDPQWHLKKKEMKRFGEVLVILSPVFRCCGSDVVQAWGFAWHDYVLLVVSLPVYRFFRSSLLRLSICYVLHVSDGSIFIHIRTYFTHDPSIEFSRNLRMDL